MTSVAHPPIPWSSVNSYQIHSPERYSWLAQDFVQVLRDSQSAARFHLQVTWSWSLLSGCFQWVTHFSTWWFRGHLEAEWFQFESLSQYPHWCLAPLQFPVAFASTHDLTPTIQQALIPSPFRPPFTISEANLAAQWARQQFPRVVLLDPGVLRRGIGCELKLSWAARFHLQVT